MSCAGAVAAGATKAICETETAHTVEIVVHVHDKVALHRHAMAKATDRLVGGMTPIEAEVMLGTEQRVDIAGCLQYVLDPGTSPPGTSIQDSMCD